MQKPGTRYTVLLIDDDPHLLPSLVAALESLSDYRVVTADNGIAGLERFYSIRPDCAVIDVKMHGLDGFQLMRAIRGDPETAQTPLVILTAMVQDQYRFTALASGADQYLTKPARPMELIEAIHSAITLSESQRDNRLRDLAEDEPPAQP